MVPLFSILLILWLMLNASLAPDVLILGLVAALVIASLFRGSLSPLTEFRATPAALRAAPPLPAVFPEGTGPLQPAPGQRRPVAFPAPEPRHRQGAHPAHQPHGAPLARQFHHPDTGDPDGGLQGEWLYVHWVRVDHDDIEGATASIVAGFERYLEVMYG